MTGVFRFSALAFALLVFSVSCLLVKMPKFDTSLESLAGGASLMPPEPIRSAASSRVQVVSSADSFDSALDLAGRFVGGLDTNQIESLAFRVNEDALRTLADFYRNAGGGFLSFSDRTGLEKGGIADSVLESVTSPAPSLFSFALDPYRFLDRFVKSLPRGFGRWAVREGVLAAEKDGKSHVLVSFSLPRSVAFDIKALPDALGPIVESCRKLSAADPSASLSVSGVPVHTLETSADCERQIAWLSCFSLAFILLLARIVLKSKRIIAIVAVNLAVAAAVGFAAVDLFFDTVHLVSLVFGTTLIGLAVDYSFHTLLSSGPEGSALVRRNLLKSFLTTIACLLPLLFSGLPALGQTAVFLCSGLGAGLVLNLSVLDFAAARRRPDERAAPAWLLKLEGLKVGDCLLPVSVSVALCGILFARFRTEPCDLHSPSAELKAAESLISSLSGIDSSSAMAVVKGHSLEDVLKSEERFFADCVCLSRFLPSVSVRSRNFALIKRFHDQEGGAIAENLGLDFIFPAPAEVKRISADLIPAPIAERFLFRREDGGVMTLVPSVDIAKAGASADASSGVEFFAPRLMLARLIDNLGKRALLLLLLSLGLLAVMLTAFFRRRAFKLLLPSVLAVACSYAAVAASGGNVNFFHLLSSFMIIGITLDYTIFLAGDYRRSLLSVTCSLLTSLAGFGALAFVSFPIVRSFGVAFAVGLPVSFLVAWALFHPRAEADERIATPIGMEMAWVCYRIFGKHAFDFIARVVADLVWISDAGSRKAAGSRRRIENFAQSLADKIAVLSMGRGQPEVRFEPSADADSFLHDVESRKGAVVISSHLGNTETLAAYGECAVKFHVFMSLSQTSVFRAFKDRHFKRTMIEAHPTEGFGMAELFLGSAIVDEGGVVLIAGDRGGGRMKEVPFAGGTHRFPEGAFRFARHLERNVYFIASVREDGFYRVFVRLLPQEDMFGSYVRELEALVEKYPDQWYQWETKGGNNG